MRLAVIGAGPMGLFAALEASRRGLDVTVFEQGRVGQAMMGWGSTRLFTPLGMNLPAGAREAIGAGLPPDDTLLTGPQMVETVLMPLARSAALEGRVREGCRVLAAGRAGLMRGELPGHPLRSQRPFRLLVGTAGGGETVHESDAVLDASGVMTTPAFAGAGGLPARGEMAAAAGLIRRLDAMEARREQLAGRRILLIGHGHSAANALLWLERLAQTDTRTRVVWMTRSAHGRPVQEVADDPLPERRRVAGGANDLARTPPEFLTVERRCSLAWIEPAGPGTGDESGWRTGFTSGREEAFDAVIALTGYRPDLTFLSELALEISPVTEGSARLARALSSVTDCLAVPRVAAGDLASGEPGFHLIGAKSYGRSRTFLLRTGIEQLATILDGLTS